MIVQTYRIQPSMLQGSIQLPPSKSHTLRALIFALLAEGKNVIHNYLDSPDTMCMIKAIQLLGATVSLSHTTIEVQGTNGKLTTPEDVIQAGNSGIILRFIGALTSLAPGYSVITGDASIRHNRVVIPLLQALSQLGAFAETTRGGAFAPILIKGPLKGGRATLDGSDSQPISGLLIAACFAEKQVELHVKNPGEKPWIDVTLSWIKRLGLLCECESYTNYLIQGKQYLKAFTYHVPTDLSSLAYVISAALVTQSELRITHIDLSDSQGDKKFIDILQKMGAHIIYDATTSLLDIKPNQQLQGIEVDINDTIDMITILAVVACFAQGTTTIKNGSIARKKECDRIHAIATELKKMGADIEEKEDGLIIRRSLLQGAFLTSHLDHRIALALSVAALGAKGESKVKGVECIAKSYPHFKKHFQHLGAKITTTL